MIPDTQIPLRAHRRVGQVRLGREVLTGESVAIKVLENSRIVDDDARARLRNEIEILRLVEHNSLLRLFEVIEEADATYLVTEHVGGGELFAYIDRKGHLSEPEAAALFAQMLSAVDSFHSIGIIHRDLKPENMLLDLSPTAKELKIIDFGLGAILPSADQVLTAACGSPHYAAPEMLIGDGYTGRRADLWSLGVCLYATLCGCLPFDEDDMELLYDKIIAGDFTFDGCPELSDGAISMIRGVHASMLGHWLPLHKPCVHTGGPPHRAASLGCMAGYPALRVEALPARHCSPHTARPTKADVVQQRQTPHARALCLFLTPWPLRPSPRPSRAGLLTTDPERRLTASQALSHHWLASFQLGHTERPSVLAGSMTDLARARVLRALAEEFSMSKDSVIEALDRRERTYETALYFLIRQREIHNGRVLDQPNFLPTPPPPRPVAQSRRPVPRRLREARTVFAALAGAPRPAPRRLADVPARHAVLAAEGVAVRRPARQPEQQAEETLLTHALPAVKASAQAAAASRAVAIADMPTSRSRSSISSASAHAEHSAAEAAPAAASLPNPSTDRSPAAHAAHAHPGTTVAVEEISASAAARAGSRRPSWGTAAAAALDRGRKAEAKGSPSKVVGGGNKPASIASNVIRRLWQPR